MTDADDTPSDEAADAERNWQQQAHRWYPLRSDPEPEPATEVTHFERPRLPPAP